jgi:type IV pilus assembly protein PilX
MNVLATTVDAVALRLKSPQRGVVVFLALVTALTMALSAVALMRVVDTTVAVSGNLGFLQSAVGGSDAAVEHAVAALFERALVADPSRDDETQGYFAALQAGENARGVPAVMQSLPAYPELAPVVDAGNGNTVRYVIERMCATAGPPDNCNLVATADTPGAPRVPLFRQSIRVDGAGGATAFVQAFLADIPGRRRVAWRALGD